MGNRSRRVYPFQSIVREWQRRKEWRACAQRIHRRAKIMQEPWQGQFEGPRSSARSRLCFKYFYLQACLSKHDCRRQPVRTGADYAGGAIHSRLRIICELRSTGQSLSDTMPSPNMKSYGFRVLSLILFLTAAANVVRSQTSTPGVTVLHAARLLEIES